MSQPASAAPSRKKTVISLLVLAALTGIIVLLFKDNWAEITAALSQLSAWQVLVVLAIAVLVWFRLYGRTRRYGRASGKRYRQHTYRGRRR